MDEKEMKMDIIQEQREYEMDSHSFKDIKVSLIARETPDSVFFISGVEFDVVLEKGDSGPQKVTERVMTQAIEMFEMFRTVLTQMELWFGLNGGNCP